MGYGAIGQAIWSFKWPVKLSWLSNLPAVLFDNVKVGRRKQAGKPIYGGFGNGKSYKGNLKPFTGLPFRDWPALWPKIIFRIKSFENWFDSI
jgi:hypothetical protein